MYVNLFTTLFAVGGEISQVREKIIIVGYLINSIFIFLTAAAVAFFCFDTKEVATRGNERGLFTSANVKL